MTAVFIARDRLSAGPSGEFARYCRSAEACGFRRIEVPGQKRSDMRCAYVRRVGVSSYCFVCECFAPDANKSLSLRKGNPTEENRLATLLHRVVDVLDVVGAPRETVQIFLHNGGDVVAGYEEWVNAQLKTTSGLENWRVALLSRNDKSGRNRVFDLSSVKFPPVFNDSTSFARWVTQLTDGLLKIGAST